MTKKALQIITDLELAKKTKVLRRLYGESFVENVSNHKNKCARLHLGLKDTIECMFLGLAELLLAHCIRKGYNAEEAPWKPL